MQLRDRGVAIFIRAAPPPEVFQCCDRATVLRDGKLVDTVGLAGVTESQLATKMVGRGMADLYRKRDIPKGEVLLSVQNLTTENGHVKNASFDLRAGEILGISGLVGFGENRAGYGHLWSYSRHRQRHCGWEQGQAG